jgi:hypothetical protein
MAKQTKSSTPVTPNFRDVDRVATARAQAAVAGGKQDPLKVPAGAKTSTDKKGVEYTRWVERVTVTQAYRTITKKGLMNVVVVTKIRQSKENNGSRAFGHFYINHSPEMPEGHAEMNDRSMGALITLLTATGYMPAGGTLKGSMLDKMFPSKGQPGVASPLNGKAVVANIVQQLAPQKDQKTNKPVLDDEGEPILEKRDNIESFLPDAPSDNDEAEEDEIAGEEEEEEEAPAPARTPAKPARRK